MTQRPETTPDWLLERIALDELPPAELAEARRRLAEEPGGLERLEALRRSNDEILATYPPRRVAHQLEARLDADRRDRARTRSSWPRMLAFATPALAAAAALLLVILPGEPPAPTPAVSGGMQTGLEPTRSKGLKPYIALHRKSADASERLDKGASAGAGDLLQLSYVSRKEPWGAILSLDGRGAVTLHLPRQPGAAAPLEPDGEVFLPFSYELDDAPSFERFFLVTSEQPFDLSVVEAAARALAAQPDAAKAPLELPEGLAQTSFLVRKRP